MSGGAAGEFRSSFLPPFTCYHQPTQSTYLTLVTNHHQQGHPGKGNVNASPPRSAEESQPTSRLHAKGCHLHHQLVVKINTNVLEITYSV